ncbi:hypothetical protein G4B88_023649, partial [Cannabis sativa]
GIGVVNNNNNNNNNKPRMELGSNNNNSSNDIIIKSNSNNNMLGSSDQRRNITRPQKDQAVNCPRCNSTNTKFCYYNNYSLTQPRYFCKTCRRYWTEVQQQLSAMELLKTGMASRGLMSSFMAMPPANNSDHNHNNGFSLGGEFKPNNNNNNNNSSSLGFDLDHGYGQEHHQTGFGSGQDHINGARLLFPNNHQDMKQVSATTSGRGERDNNQDHSNNNNSNGYWNGMLGGGSW